ncbi:MAG: N-acylglucosamine 2-epimerase [bacterium]|nr:N-acylglucosamine 2-epimerase [bacterium]
MRMLPKIITVFIFAVIASLPANSQPANAHLDELRQAKTRIQKILLENIDAFWLPQLVDVDRGGYQLNHDAKGEWQGPESKGIVTQARCLWYFSAMLNHGFGDDRHRAAADHGFSYFRDRMWDDQYGGFYQQMAEDGEKVEIGLKHLYGESFMLYGLSEYYKATRNPLAIDLAWRLASLLDRYAHDDEFGGFRESFNRDWSPAGPDVKNLMNVPNDFKLMNTHLHLLEAYSTWYEVSRDPGAREDLLELIAIQSNAVVRKTVGGCTDKYLPNWLPIDKPEYNIVSYGHDIENVWLLMEACRSAGVTDGPLLDLYETLMKNSMQYGFDWDQGGFYDTGKFNEPASSRTKVWWVQAEGIVASLRMFERTGDERYWKCFQLMLDWIDKHQVDWKYGDWSSSISEDGKRQGGKANLWKSPYHNGRAMMQCIETIDRMLARTE